MNANESARSPLTALGGAIAQFWTKDVLPLLADLRLAIVLLLAIALFSISGTVIEQGQTLAFYQENYPEDPALFGFLSWKVVLLLGLNSVYRTWWFLALLILFGASLTACTFTRQLPALKAARGWSYYRQPRQFEKLALSARLDGPGDRPGDRGAADPLATIDGFLRTKGYRTYRDGDVFYARKGIVGRIGPIVVHAAMLIVLAGAIVGAATGFLAQEIVPSGQTFRVQNILDAGPWSQSQIPRDWAVKVNRFWIDYTPDGNIDQFYSDLSVVDLDGNERDRQTIHVNKPLRYGGITMYQTDWGIAAVRLHVNNSPILELPMAQLPVEGGRIWGTWVPTKTDLSDGVSLVTKDLQGTLLIYDKTGKPIATARTGRSVQVNGVTLSLDELVGSTGLQIKADPGIPLVYGGFGLLMLGVVLSYFSHSQVWGLVAADGLYVGGRTNRAQVAFERELLAAIAAIEAPTPAATAPAGP